MAKENVTVRLERDLIEWADLYAAERRWARTTVFVAALEALRGDAKGGVPDVPMPALEEPRASPKPTRPAAPRAPVPAIPGMMRGRDVPTPGRAEDHAGGPSFLDSSVTVENFTTPQAFDAWRERAERWRGA